MKSTHFFAAAALVALAAVPSAGDDKLTLPSSPPPAAAIARLDSDGQMTLRMRVGPERKSGKDPDDKARASREETYRLEPNEYKVYDHTGKEVDAKAQAKLLAKETLTLYSYSRRPDQAYFSMLREGVLVIAYFPQKPTWAAGPVRPVPGLGAFLEKQGYIAVQLVRSGDRLGVRVKVKGEELLLGLDTGASFVHFDKERVGRLALKWDSDNTCALAGLEIGGIEVGTLRAHVHDMSETNVHFEAAGEPPIDGLLGAQVLMPLSAVIDHAGATLYLKKPEKPEPKK